MLSSKIILTAQRSHRALGGKLWFTNQRSSPGSLPGVRWVHTPNSDDENNNEDELETIPGRGSSSISSSRRTTTAARHQHQPQYQYHQRRNLSTGRRQGWKNDTEKKPKENFAEKFLEPAARGELQKGHTSGIPKLAVRKSKGHKIQGIPDDGTDSPSLGDAEFEAASEWGSSSGDESLSEGDGPLMQTLSEEVTRAKEMNRQSTMGGGGRGSAGSAGGGRGGGGNNLVPRPSSGMPSEERGVFTLSYDNGRSPEYWREEEYDDEGLTEEDRAFVRELVELGENAPVDAGGDDDDFDFTLADLKAIDFEAADEEEEEKGEAKEGEGEASDEKAGEEGEAKKAVVAKYDADQTAADEEQKGRAGQKRREAQLEAKARESSARKMQADCISPLTISGPTGEDFWNDLSNHPTMYAELRHYNLHPESKREPKPYYPKNRANPPPEFVDYYKRWMFVTGLPPALSDDGMKHGESTALTVTQEQEIEMTVTRLLGVTSEQVFPANETSAFVGFEAPEDREAVFDGGPNEKTIARPVEISTYTATPEDDKYNFLKDVSVDTVVQLEHLPPGRFSRDTLARDLFPKGSELGDAYSLTSENVVFPSPTKALIKFGSAEQAKSALCSESVAARLAEIGDYPVQILRARRNLVFQQMAGPLRNHEIRRQGDRLIVDGDMPTKNFHLSHAGTIMIRNIDYASVSKATLTEFFQPFSKLVRDENGSIEFVTCEQGLPPTTAYVGFENLGEAEAVMAEFKGRARIGDSPVQISLIRDRKIPGLAPRVARSERTEEELLKSLNDWEQYVDPADIAHLEANGVAKVVVDEALRGIRFHNRSFGSLDDAMQGEKLENEKESGEDYKELVQEYIATLKECVATPEEPGEMWELMHFPGEPIDTTVFEKEKKRQKKLMEKRGL